MYIIISWAITKEIYTGLPHKEIFKWNTKQCTNNPEEGKKGGRKKWKTEKTNIKQTTKLVNLSPDISIITSYYSKWPIDTN